MIVSDCVSEKAKVGIAIFIFLHRARCRKNKTPPGFVRAGFFYLIELGAWHCR